MNKRHYEHTLPNIRGSLSNTYIDTNYSDLKCKYTTSRKFTMKSRREFTSVTSYPSDTHNRSDSANSPSCRNIPFEAEAKPVSRPQYKREVRLHSTDG